MSEHRFTPGPWRAAKWSAWDATAELDMWPIEYGEPDKETGAQSCVAFAFEKEDMVLIAAAPDLLEALQVLVRGQREGWWGEGSGEMEEGELQLAEAAIAKALGE